MQTLTLDDLARLDERAAVERHFDQQNDRVIRWVIPFSVIGALPMLAVFSSDDITVVVARLKGTGGSAAT